MVQGNDTYELVFAKRAIPLGGLTLPQEHVNWVLSRLLEYTAYLAQVDFVHCGLMPENVFIVPENHGIIIISFYHLTRIGSTVKTISAKYKDWYPPELLQTKLATSGVDLEMVKKIAIYLLGDQSGAGVKLRKTHNADFINFLIKRHDDPYNTYKEYRELLKNNFESKFHVLNI
jgi:serine/threonine protein kinase